MSSFKRATTHDENLPPSENHHNTANPYHHVPVGIRSEEVENFEELEINENGKIDLGKLFPAVENTGWHGYLEWEQNPEMVSPIAQHGIQCAKVLIQQLTIGEES